MARARTTIFLALFVLAAGTATAGGGGALDGGADSAEMRATGGGSAPASASTSVESDGQSGGAASISPAQNPQLGFTPTLDLLVFIFLPLPSALT